MHSGAYNDYFDVPIPAEWRKLVGQVGAFLGYKWPKKWLPREYGLPESDVFQAAVWSFTQLPLFQQLCLIDEQDRREHQ